MSPRRRRSGIKSLVGSWRGQQIARESLQDRLASLPYEVLEEFLRQQGYEPANRGHAVILMVRHFQAEAEEMVARYGRADSSLNKVDTVSDTVEDTAADTVPRGVSDTVSRPEGRVSPTGQAPGTDTVADTAADTAEGAGIETATYTVSDTVTDTASDTLSDTGSRSLDIPAESEELAAGSATDTAKATPVDTGCDTVSDTVWNAASATVSDTVADAAANTVVDTVAGNAADTVADTAPDTVADTVAHTSADTAHATARATVANTSSDTQSDTSEDTVDAAADTPADTVLDTPAGTAAAAEPKPRSVADRGAEAAGEQHRSAESQAGAPMWIVLPAWEGPLEVPAASEVRWLPASQWRGPGRAAAEFLKNRARWWVERRSAAEAGATQLVGVYLLPEYRATLEQLRSETGMEAYKLLGLALELFLHVAAAGEALPELPPREGRSSRVLYLFGLQARPRLDQEGKRLFVRLYPPLWQAVERISKASHRSPSETCNIAVYVLSTTLSQLAP